MINKKLIYIYVLPMMLGLLIATLSFIEENGEIGFTGFWGLTFGFVVCIIALSFLYIKGVK